MLAPSDLHSDTLQRIRNICIDLARESPCQKLRFGAILVEITGPPFIRSIALGTNSTMEPVKHLCQPTCIRLTIPSRTQSMIGACAHAEERALWAAARRYPEALSRAHMFVQGIDMEGEVVGHPSYSCIRCSTACHLAGIRSLSHWWEDQLLTITPDEAMGKALQWAMKSSPAG